mgnify:CR=1 FL=1
MQKEKNIKDHPCQVEIDRICDAYGYHLMQVNGMEAEGFPENCSCFANAIQYIGITFNFLEGEYSLLDPITDIDRETRWKIREPYYQLNDLLFEIYSSQDSEENPINKEGYGKCRQKVKSLYEKILPMEIKNRLVRVSYTRSLYDPKAFTRNRYTFDRYCFSPPVLKIDTVPKTNIIPFLAEYFSRYVLDLSRRSPHCVMNVYVKEDIGEKDIFYIYKMMSEIMDVFNAYKIKEFQMNKRKWKYRHRLDIDPNNW